jgi:hypothetical protein
MRGIWNVEVKFVYPAYLSEWHAAGTACVIFSSLPNPEPSQMRSSNCHVAEA